VRRHVAERKGRNPSTGAALTIKAHNAVRYRAPRDWDLSSAKVFAGKKPAAALAKKPAAAKKAAKK
jgi:hypothetical protein